MPARRPAAELARPLRPLAAQVLGALASVMTVWLVTGILLFEAVQRIIHPEYVDGKSEWGEEVAQSGMGVGCGTGGMG